MRRTRGGFFRNLDWVIVGLYLVLVLMGWINIYAASLNLDHPSIFDLEMSYGKQLLWIGLAVVLVWAISLIDADFFEQFAYPIFGFTLLLLIGVLLFGKEINGNKSWFVFGPVSLQPAEFAKIGAALALARFLTTINTQLQTLYHRLTALAIIGLPAVLILMQPDTGSAMVFAAFIFVLYREGMSGNVLLLGLLAVVLFILALLFDTLDVAIGLWGILMIGLAIIQENYKFTVGAVVAFAGVFVLANYIELPAPWIIGTVLVLAVGYVLVLALGKPHRARAVKLLALAAFVGVTGFVFSVDYIFTNVLKEHQRTRITVLLGEEDKLADQITTLRQELSVTPDSLPIYQEMVMAVREKRKSLDNLKRGAGYNVNQSKIAIGSGGFVGKGFLQGTQTKYKFVPEQNTDFIFCTVGEEWGFIGSTLVIGVLLFLMIRVLFVAERQRSRFARIYGYSVASILFFHMVINMGMTMGLVPVIGIPLPFFSYGGSSLWGFTLLLFVFLRLDADRMTVLR